MKFFSDIHPPWGRSCKFNFLRVHVILDICVWVCLMYLIVFVFHRSCVLVILVSFEIAYKNIHLKVFKNSYALKWWLKIIGRNFCDKMRVVVVAYCGVWNNISIKQFLMVFWKMTRTRTCAYQGIKNLRFSENLACFVFLLLPFWDSPFCHITDELLVVVNGFTWHTYLIHPNYQ